MRKGNLRAGRARRPSSLRRLRPAERDRIALAIQAARFGIWDWDLPTGRVECSGNVPELFGFPPGRCPQARELLSRVHPDDRELVMRPAARGPFEIEYRVVLPDRRTRWVASRGLIFADAEGRPIRRVAAIFDITSLKLAQQATMDRNERLVRRVERRTALLEDMARQLEAFSFSVSHDVRAPLRAMINYADFARKGCEGRVDDLTLSYLEKISSAAYRLDKLTHDLLRFSRLSKAPPSIAAISLAALVAEILEEYPALEAAKAFIQTADVQGQVAANESMLRQALANLLENAVKFRDPERPLVVRLWVEEANGRIKLLIKDNGVGIEPRHQGRIFLPFERLRPGEAGTGMGLALVKRAIERMGGRVGFSSEPGKGSTFWLELPKA